MRLAALVVVLGALFALKHVWWPPAFRSLAGKELHLGHVENALAWLEYVDWLVPNDAGTTLLRARAYRKLGEMLRVEKLLNLARKQGASEEQIRRERILALAQSGQLRDAEQYLPEFLSNTGEDLDDVCEAYVIGFTRNQRFNEAFSLLEAWVRDSPDLATPLLLRGKLWAYRMSFAEAEADFRGALNLDPTLDEARLELSLIFIQGGRYDEAVPLLEECLDEPRLRATAIVNLVVCLNATDEVPRALALLLSSRDEFPDDPRILLELGRAQFRNGEYEPAVETLTVAVAIDPLNDEAHYTLGLALSRCGREEEAAPHFEWVDRAREANAEIDRLRSVVSKDPLDVDSLVRLGQLYMEYANTEEGVVRLLSVLDLDPEQPLAHRLLFEYYSRQAEDDPAYQVLADEHRRYLQ